MHGLRVGGWHVHRELNQLARGGETLRLEPKVMDLLVYLAANAGRVLTKSEIMATVWPDCVVSESALMSAVSDLRRALGDDARTPRILETISRRGYRLVAPVEAADAHPVDAGRGSSRRRRALLAALASAAAAAVVTAIAWGWLDGRGRRSVVPGIESIAVLPFESASGDPKHEYFADGMTEAIITELGRMSALRVISRQSMLRYKGTRKALPEIARELGVDALLEGMVVRSGGRVRVTAQLVRASPEGQLWSQSYERDLDDVLRLQGEIARAVARQTQVRSSPGGAQRQQRARPVAPGVYEHYVEGRHALSRYRPGILETSVEHFESALAEDPGFAPAHVGLAEAYLALMIMGSSSRELWSRVADHARRAGELDPSLDEAHRMLAMTAFHADWNWRAAEEELKQALALNPSSAAAYDQYANLLLVTGRLDQAVDARRRSLVLDPLSHVFNCNAGFTYYWARRYDEAAARARQNLELFGPSCPSERFVVAMAAGQQRRYAEAIEALEAAPDPAAPRRLTELAYVYAASGDRARARQILQGLTDRAEAVDPFLLAQVYVGLGDREPALAQLESAYRQRSFWMPWLAVEPKFDSLRAAPRFAALVRLMSL